MRHAPRQVERHRWYPWLISQSGLQLTHCPTLCSQSYNTYQTCPHPLIRSCAGHSLGGALGELAAIDISKAAADAGIRVQLSCYTFGAPRVGNHAFAAECGHIMPDAWSIVNDQVAPAPTLARDPVQCLNDAASMGTHVSPAECRQGMPDACSNVTDQVVVYRVTAKPLAKFPLSFGRSQ